MCKPCNFKCKCRLRCNNPHNNGGTCLKCAVADSLDADLSEDDTDDGDEELPIVPRSEVDDFGSDSDTDTEEIGSDTYVVIHR